MEGHFFPEAPYALPKLVNLTHTPPVVDNSEDDITPVPQPFLLTFSGRWRRVWEVWTNAVRAAPSMVKSNPWLLFDRFWKHCGGRLSDGRNALNFDSLLDFPYIQAAEEFLMVLHLLSFMDRVESHESGPVRECKLFLYRGSYAQ